MVYRGEDLDLRTPQMGMALGRDLARGGSGEPAANGTHVRTGADDQLAELGLQLRPDVENAD